MIPGVLHYKTLWLVTGWLYVAGIIYSSLSRMPDIDVPFDHTDKLVHFLMYFILTSWFCQIYRNNTKRRLILFAAIILGLIIEFLQGMTAYRSMDYLDFLANAIGVVVAWLMVKNNLLQYLHLLDRLLYTHSNN